MPQNLSRVTFEPELNRTLLLYSQQRPLLDAELDEQQRLKRFITELLGAAVYGSGPVGDAFTVLETGVANSLAVLPGYGYDKGVFLRSLNTLIVSGLTTPVSNRTDYVYIEWYYREVDSIEDPSIIDPILGIETATREIIEFTIGVSEGVPISDPIAGRSRIRIASINRIGADPNITTAMIVDERMKWRHTYVDNGLRVSAGVGLSVAVQSGKYYSGDIAFNYAGGTVSALPASTTLYIYANASGVVTYSTSYPFNNFQVPLAIVKTNSIGIDSISDLRFHIPTHVAVEREVRDARGTHPSLSSYLLTEHFADGTHNLAAMFTGGIDRENWRSLKPTQNTVPDLQIQIAPGRYTAPSGLKTNDFAGGLSPVFASPNPLTGTRIDLITITEANTLNIIPGVPSLVLPIPPTYPDDQLVIAEVTVIPPPSGPAVITDAEIRDVRPFLNIGYGAGMATSAPEMYELISLPSAQFNTGTNTFTLTGNFTNGDNSLAVFRNGKKLVVGIDYAEIGSNQVQLLYTPTGSTNHFEFIVELQDRGYGSAPRLYELQNGSAAAVVLGSSEFTLTSGFYTPSALTPSLSVFRNGKRLVPNIDWLQISPTQIRMNGYTVAPTDIFEFIDYT